MGQLGVKNSGYSSSLGSGGANSEVTGGLLLPILRLSSGYLMDTTDTSKFSTLCNISYNGATFSLTISENVFTKLWPQSQLQSQHRLVVCCGICSLALGSTMGGAEPMNAEGKALLSITEAQQALIVNP